MSGRVDIYQNLTYPSYDRVAASSHSTPFNTEAVRGIQENNQVSSLYFSAKNIDALQEGIRYLVYMKSCQKHVIGKQPEDELKVIMRSIYLQFAKNQPFDALAQVRELNAKVLEYCVPRVLEEIDQYNLYTKQISTLPIPLENAQNVSKKGTQVLEMREF